MSLREHGRPMTIDAFLAFADERPDGEKWELIDGVPVINPSPSRNYQKIVLNILYELEVLARRGLEWEVLPGIGAKLSNTSMSVPDVLIRPARPAGHFCDDDRRIRSVVAVEQVDGSSLEAERLSEAAIASALRGGPAGRGFGAMLRSYR